jgi:hypothetical protein
MKRLAVLGLLVISTLGIVVSASADDKNQKGRKRTNNQPDHTQQRQFGSAIDAKRGDGGQIKNVLEIVQTFKKHHKDKPTRPDDRVEVPEPQAPPSRPGYVWVNGHWERAKSTPALPTGGNIIVNPIQPSMQTRDHRTPHSPGNQRDTHPIPPPLAVSNGSVTVTVTNPNQKPRDHAIRGVGFPFIEIGPLYSTLNDHRDPKKSRK